MAGHCSVPDAVLRHAEEHISKRNRHEQCIASAEVTYTEEKRSRKAEVILHIDGTEPIVELEFRSVLDKTVDRVARMLKRERRASSRSLDAATASRACNRARPH